MTSNEKQKEQVTWRLTEEEFYKKADEYISAEFEKVKKNAEEGKYIGECEKQIICSLGKVRSAEQNGNSLSFIRKLKAETMCHDTTNWSNSRFYNSDHDSVIFRILINRIFDVQCICTCYVCGVKNQLTEQMIKDIVFINSDLFDFEYWDDHHVEIINGIVRRGNKYNCVKDLENLAISKDVSDRFKQNIHNLLTEAAQNSSIEKKIYSLETQIKSVSETIKNSEIGLSIYKSLHIETGKDKRYYNGIVNEFVQSLENEISDFDNKFWTDLQKTSFALYRSYKMDSLEELKDFVFSGISDQINNRINRLDIRLEKLNEDLEKLKKDKNKDFRKIILTERLDWRSINIYQTLTPEFKEQYKDLFKYCFEAATKDN